MDILGEADQGPGAEGGVSGEVDLAKAPSKSALISATSMRNVRVSRKGLHKRHVTSIDWKEQEIPFVLCLSDSIQSGSAFSCWRGAFTSLISTAKAKSRTNRTGTTGDKGASKLDIITNVLEGGGVELSLSFYLSRSPCLSVPFLHFLGVNESISCCRSAATEAF